LHLSLVAAVAAPTMRRTVSYADTRAAMSPVNAFLCGDQLRLHVAAAAAASSFGVLPRLHATSSGNGTFEPPAVVAEDDWRYSGFEIPQPESALIDVAASDASAPLALDGETLPLFPTTAVRDDQIARTPNNFASTSLTHPLHDCVNGVHDY
jgi:hypothetical protein